MIVYYSYMSNANIVHKLSIIIYIVNYDNILIIVLILFIMERMQIFFF